MMAVSYNILIPNQVLMVLDTLEAGGFEVFIVGGCVRDGILGRIPTDWDITTNARPEQIKALFPHTIDTGIKHGTVTVLTGERSLEITTYRVDGEYTDHRRPESVKYTSSITKDLSRRDFTMNAIAYHPKKGFVDPFNGLEDIEGRIIRTVGDPASRFTEDALRMLRAIRFSAQLDFSIEGPTLMAIKNNSALIEKISCERIREELTKILISPIPQRFELLYETGLLKYIMPEFESCFKTEQNHPCHIYNVASHTLKSLSMIENSPVYRWTMLLHDIGKPYAKFTDEKGVDHFYGHNLISVKLGRKILTRLKFDTKSSEKILKLVELHDRVIEPTPRAVRRALSKLGGEIFIDLLKVMRADCQAQNPEYLKDRLVHLDQLLQIRIEILEEKHCTSIETLAVNGDDLKSIGFKEGKEIGKALNRLLDSVIENPQLNNKESLLELASKIKENLYSN